MAKLKVIIYGLVSCAGCQLQILNLEEELLDIITHIDIVNFKEAQSNNEPGPYDIAFIEGTVTCQREIDKIKKIRKESNIVIALGTCACYGNIPALKNYYDEGDAINFVYKGNVPLSSLDKFSGIDKYIKVDHYMHGCPIAKNDFIQILKDVLLEKPLTVKNYHVCVDCKLKENRCLLDVGIVCLGPVARAGCGAICPSYDHTCDCCRGPIDNSNFQAELKIFKEKNISNDEILKRLRLFVGTAKQIEELIL